MSNETPVAVVVAKAPKMSFTASEKKLLAVLIGAKGTKNVDELAKVAGFKPNTISTMYSQIKGTVERLVEAGKAQPSQLELLAKCAPKSTGQRGRKASAPVDPSQIFDMLDSLTESEGESETPAAE